MTGGVGVRHGIRRLPDAVARHPPGAAVVPREVRRVSRLAGALAADAALWQSARAAAQGGPRVLMATTIGSYAHGITLESAVGRGADVQGCRSARPALRRRHDRVRGVRGVALPEYRELRRTRTVSGFVPRLHVAG